MRQVSGEQLGSALRRLTADLAAERRRTVLLTRENRELRQQIESLERALSEEKARHADPRKVA
jgi:cell division septum initiation protein DivIVA